MGRTVTEEEMESRKRMSRAKCKLSEAMADFITDDCELSAVEWMWVLQEMQMRMFALQLQHEWSENE